jgi:hypothetical protein
MFVIKLKLGKIKVDRPEAVALAKVHGVRRVRDYCRKTMNQAIIDCPVDTGNLRAHHRMRVKETSLEVRGEVYNDANYAALVHDGSKAHIIRGRRMRRPTKKRKYKGVKTLRFTVGGQVVFRRLVHHPGSKGRPWLRDAAKKVASSEGFLWKPGASA